MEHNIRMRPCRCRTCTSAPSKSAGFPSSHSQAPGKISMGCCLRDSSGASSSATPVTLLFLTRGRMKYSIFDLVNESRAVISPTTREASGAGRQGQALFHGQLINALLVHLVGFETTTQPSLLSDARMQARK